MRSGIISIDSITEFIKDRDDDRCVRLFDKEGCVPISFIPYCDRSHALNDFVLEYVLAPVIPIPISIRIHPIGPLSYRNTYIGESLFEVKRCIILEKVIPDLLRVDRQNNLRSNGRVIRSVRPLMHFLD